MLEADSEDRGPGTHLAETLDDARARGFVGRAAELAVYRDALTGASKVRVLFVHGPGGIGKTTLLDAFGRETRQRGRQAIYVDARDLACSIEAVSEALQVNRRSTADEPAALLVDGYELLAPLDRWFREVLVPSRPAGSVTVLAGRAPPAAGWRLDPGWRQLIQIQPLGELGHAESTALLEGLGIGSTQCAALADLGRGWPLALAMLAEAVGSGAAPAQLSDTPDVVAQLCGLIVDDVPDAAHRAGLATCAHTTRLTEELLDRTIGERSSEVWRWLESRPYVRHGNGGLILHDVVGELFEEEFARRTPAAYAALHRSVRDYFLERLIDPDNPYPDRAAAEILLLHRHSPLAADIATLRVGGLLSVPKAGPRDHAEMIDLVRSTEGPESADLAERWIAEQPRGLYRIRSDFRLEAFCLQTYLPASPALVADDPVSGAVLRAVEDRGPLRPGERINIGRFSGATGDGYRNPLMLLVNGVASILEWAHQPAAWTFITTPDPDYFGPYFEYLGLTRMLDVQTHYGTTVGFGWDRRRFPVTAFFELMARRELTGETGPPPADLLRPAPMSRTTFDDAVRDALRLLARPDRLRESPLVTTALVDPSADDRGAVLGEVLRTAIAAQGTYRGVDERRLLERTLAKGAPSQESVAHVLDLPFSTYRRHLARATDAVIDYLWAVETGQPGAPYLGRGTDRHAVAGQELGTP
jgi:hypothetical protein